MSMSNVNRQPQTEESKKIIFLEEDIYMVCDEDENPHYYHRDPLKKLNRERAELDFANMIYEKMERTPSITNPFMLRIAIFPVERGSHFDPSVPDKIRRGVIDAHLEDLDGNIVEITSKASKDEAYPLNGVIYDDAGKIAETRMYAPDGQCIDGVESHRLFTVKGAF